MAEVINIRIQTLSKAMSAIVVISPRGIKVVNNTLVMVDWLGAEYVLGSLYAENIVVETPPMPQECGCSTTNAQVLATLIKGVDGVTPDMSDYYGKSVIDEKLGEKQDAISDLEAIRSGASKGTTALQLSDVEEEITFSSKPIQSTAVLMALSDIERGKQDKISDLDAIREGASKGATALQSVPSEYVTEGELQKRGYATKKELESKQDVISDLDAIRDGAAKGATALQEHQPLKTINGESIIGEGDITIEGGGGGDLAGYATEEYVDNAVEAVNVKGEDGYVYSNGEKVDMRIRRSLIPIGTLIPAKANLNTIAYLKVGNYYCSQTTNAKTITNCPVEVAFSMEVFNPLSENLDDETTAQYTYRIRKITAYNTGVQYIQYCNTSGTAGTWTYGSWYVMPRTSFSLASDKNGGSAVKGGSTRGVYIDASGTFQQMSYTIAKSVPSNAVFTDTNTKVTSVDNHYTPAEDADAAINAPEGEVVVGLKRDAAGHVVGIETSPQTGGDISDLEEALAPRNVGVVDTTTEVDDTISYATTDYVNGAIASAITLTINADY